MRLRLALAVLVVFGYVGISFAAVPASSPLPVDGRAWIEPANVRLHWTPPEGNPSPIDHYQVLLDEDPAVIANPDGVADFGGTSDVDDPSFQIGALERDRTYYWRVDTVLDDETVVTGDVWSFATERIDIPGTVVDFSPDPANIYYMSPSIAIPPDGTYLATHDVSGAGGAHTVVLESPDGGINWREIAQVAPLHWASLFVHDGALYLMGDSGGGANSRCVILRSDDGGHTWTSADDENTGVLFPDTGYHTAPVPVVVHDGRIWRAMEDRQDPGDWATYFRAFMMSAPEDADLLVAANWTATNRLSFDEETWLGTGWLEGNAVVTPDGDIVNILRVAGSIPSLFVVETAAMVHVSDDGLAATFDPSNDFIDFPGGGVKFTIRYDETTDLYWSLVNTQRDPYAMRNRLCLTASSDLVSWTVVEEILYSHDPVFHAWQYVDWLFEGDDIVFVSRTAHPMGGGVMPHGYHDANFTTFHRIDNYADLLDGDDDDSDDDTTDDLDDDTDDDAADDDLDDDLDDDMADDDSDDDSVDDDDDGDDDASDESPTTSPGEDDSVCGC